MTSGVPITLQYTGESNERLDKVLLERLPKELSVSRSQIKRWIESGAVLVDGSICAKAGSLVRPQSRIVITEIPEKETEITGEDIPLDIVFEDEELLVINKQPNFVVHPGAGIKTSTVMHAVAGHLQKEGITPPSRMGIVHRLDKDTTGILVVCKTEHALNNVSAQFAEREVKKRYHALVFYTPRSKHLIARNDEGEIATLIGRHPTMRVKMTVLEEGGRNAITRFKVIERFTYGALVAVEILTGRTHQIRVHLEHVKTPIVGDTVYGYFAGLPEDLKRAAEKFGRQALHAAQLTLKHPFTTKETKFEALRPADFENLIEEFRKR